MLSNKISIVTGSGQGIGRAIALAFAQANARVVVAELNVATGNQTVADIRKMNQAAIYCEVDVTKNEQVSKLVQDTLNAFGRIDILVNNAGGGYSLKSVMEMPEDEWDRVITLNLKSTFLCSKAIGLEMAKQGTGSIINIASLAGLQSFPLRSHYAAAKGAIVIFTKTMATEMGPLNVRVNAIAPGQIKTALLEGVHAKNPGLRDERISRVPLKRFGEPEEVAKVALFLGSDLSSYMTGEIFGVNGGLDSQVTAKELLEIRSKFETVRDTIR